MQSLACDVPFGMAALVLRTNLPTLVTHVNCHIGMRDTCHDSHHFLRARDTATRLGITGDQPPRTTGPQLPSPDTQPHRQVRLGNFKRESTRRQFIFEIVARADRLRAARTSSVEVIEAVRFAGHGKPNTGPSIDGSLTSDHLTRDKYAEFLRTPTTR